MRSAVVKCASSSSGRVVKFAYGSTVMSAGEGFLVVNGLTLMSTKVNEFVGGE